MENAEEVLHFLEEFSKRKARPIPQELNDYLAYVARTGDPVYQWPLVKSLFKEKLLNVITDFYETSPGIDIPPYPNVDPFNYDTMKNSLLERLDSFSAAPFTVQRICELLTYPRKQYNRIDKFMRAIEKNILVVSTREPGIQRHNIEPENGEPIVNGSDNNSEYNVDVEMEDMSWKENSNQQQNIGPQPGSSEAHISVDDIETRLQSKPDITVTCHENILNEYESVTPPEENSEPLPETKPNEEKIPELAESTITSSSVKIEETETPNITPENLQLEETKNEVTISNIIIPEIKIDDAEMTEQKLIEQSLNPTTTDESPTEPITEIETMVTKEKEAIETQQPIVDKNNTDLTSKEESDPKLFSEISTSSEESSSSGDNIDGNSNSPKTDIENPTEIQVEQSHVDSTSDSQESVESTHKGMPEDENEPIESTKVKEESPQLSPQQVILQSDNYSISDVNSVLLQSNTKADTEIGESILKEESVKSVDTEKHDENPKTEATEVSVDEKET